MTSVIDGVKSLIWNSAPNGYGSLKTKAPMISGDTSDEESDEESNGTSWSNMHNNAVVGSELGANIPSSSVSNSSEYHPQLGGPFSALVQSMWPQNILSQIQQEEKMTCQYDEFGFRIEQESNKTDLDYNLGGTFEDPSIRLRWTAYIEASQKGIVGDLTWDKVPDSFERTEKLTELVYSGIPHSMRVHLWPRLSGASRKKRESEMSYRKIQKSSKSDKKLVANQVENVPDEKIEKLTEHLYPGISHSMHVHNFQINSESDTLVANQIEKDLCRTMPSNACFENMDSIGIPKLKRVLLAIAWLYPDIGYCQGMGMVVGNLLLFLEEEDVFWMMVAIIEDLLPSSYYSSSLIGVQVDQRVLRQLIVGYLPHLDELMKEHDIELGLITLHWFLTAMSSVFDIKILLRVWDIFFYEGSISLFKITLGMMKFKEKALLAVENSAQIFNMMSNLPGEIVDVDLLLEYSKKAAASLTQIILDTHRKKHHLFLLAEMNQLDDNSNNNIEPKEIHRRTRPPSKKSWINLAFDISTSIYYNSILCGTGRKHLSAITMKAKNVLQTEILSDLRESIFLIARHFDYKGTKTELLPDYTTETTLKENHKIKFERVKQRRAKGLIDFERHEDDELGFRKNDLITIVSQKDEHCWIGELNGLRGWFPAKFVQVLDERSKEYSSAGDDSVSEVVADLVRGKLYQSFKRILNHGLKQPPFSGHVHPWQYIEEASKREVQKDFHSVYSRLVLCKTYRLDEDGKILSPDETLYRAVQLINAQHDEAHSNNDAKLCSLICYGLNEQVLHSWFEVFCVTKELSELWYEPYSYIRSPGWIQIKYELLVLSKFSFNLSLDYEINEKKNTTSTMKEDVQDMLVKHHLFSWDL
ncbi:small G protein signaling modulator 3 isoform X1 [Hydra vulgaris]|uniref:small G protein signaling modulator 3 isoform X1 n=1 Tax=Hydra vulgaris TaxID=6087 RepID=UPI0032EA7DC5